MHPFRLFLLAVLLLSCSGAVAATVDSINIHSTVMNKTYKAAVVVPASYAHNKSAYPVLYLLYGGGGHFRDWLTLTPDRMLVKNLADQYHLIIVMPEGETFSWYLNSPLIKESQFETYITVEVRNTVDSMYRTVRNSKGRVITGLSMGGHGALYIALRNPSVFGTDRCYESGR